jgi:hypothetical protein
MHKLIKFMLFSRKALFSLFIVSSFYFFSCQENDHFHEDSPSNNGSSSNVEQAFEGKHGVVKDGSIKGQPITYEVIDNHNVFEGDILLTSEQLSPSSAVDKRTDGTGRSNLATRWPGGVVYYTIDPSLPNQSRVTNAIAHWEANTSIRFQLRTTQNNYVAFIPGGGCSSYVGMTGGQQVITLASGCSTGNTIHEIGHAIGLWHEQSRADRNNYITIHYGNVQSGTEHNFRTYLEQNLDGFDFGALDFRSIMLYDSYAFSKNGLPTITKIDGSTYASQRNGLSPEDIATVNYMYPGFTNWAGTETMTSMNGYLYIVQNHRLHQVDANGKWKVLGPPAWEGTEAMTSMNGYLYIVQNQRLHRVDTEGNWTVLGPPAWGGTEAMTSMNGYLYIVQNQRLHRVDTNGVWTVLGPAAWAGTEAMTAMDGYLYIVQNQRLHRVDTNGVWTVLGPAAWAGTEAMTSLDSHLYIVQNQRLHRVNTTGQWTVLGPPAWAGTEGMTTLNGYLYIVQNERLHRVDLNGNWVVI